MAKIKAIRSNGKVTKAHLIELLMDDSVTGFLVAIDIDNGENSSVSWSDMKSSELCFLKECINREVMSSIFD